MTAPCCTRMALMVRTCSGDQALAGHQARSWLGGCPRGGGITTGGITAALLIAGIILRSSGGIREGLVVLGSLVSKGVVLPLFAIMILLGISSAKDPIDLEFFFKTPANNLIKIHMYQYTS
ncbi:hypothetical protein Droror1_Dr00005734 [Drosera rotundifolia]